jgi:hypothetical protein
VSAGRSSAHWLPLLLVAAVLGGCGGSGEAVESTSAARGADGRSTAEGGDTSIQEFGHSADETELRAAAGTLHRYLAARARRDWSAACRYLSRPVKAGFAGFGGCAKAMVALSGNVSEETLREAAIARVGELRLAGNRGFLIYRGPPRGTLYAISVSRESGKWKLGSLVGTPLA